MHLATYDNVEGFLKANSSFLHESEVENNVLLGTLGDLSADAFAAEQETYLAAILDDDAAPLLCAVAARGRNLMLSTARPAALPGATTLVASDLYGKGLQVPGLVAEDRLARRFVADWAPVARCTPRLSMRQMLYVLHKLNEIERSPGRLRVAAAADRDLIADWSHAFGLEALGSSDRAAAQRYAQSRIEAQDIFLWEVTAPVCMAARARPTRRGVAINHVYTPPPCRRRGYATSCVAALTEHLLASGYSFCTLYADLANRESNGIYARIGFEPLVQSSVFTFEYPGAQTMA